MYVDGAHQRKTIACDAVTESLADQDLTVLTSVIWADVSFANTSDVYLSTAYQHLLIQDFIFYTSIAALAYNIHHDDGILPTQKSWL